MIEWRQIGVNHDAARLQNSVTFFEDLRHRLARRFMQQYVANNQIETVVFISRVRCIALLETDFRTQCLCSGVRVTHLRCGDVYPGYLGVRKYLFEGQG